MNAPTVLSLALACAPQVHANTVAAVVRVESGANPWAIGIVGAALLRQPQHRAEALATAKALQAAGWNFSVGLAQINVSNFKRLGLTLDSAFEPCRNLAAMQTVLGGCFERALSTALPAAPSITRPASSATTTATTVATTAADQAALRQALSCYYSGNFTTGFRDGYVRKVAAAAGSTRTVFATAPPKENV